MSYKVSVDYDKENDIIFLYKKGVRSRGSIELGPDISIDFGEGGNPVGLEIVGASTLFSKMCGVPVSKTALSHIKKAALRSEVRDNFIYVYYAVMWIIAKPSMQEKEASGMLPVPQVVGR